MSVLINKLVLPLVASIAFLGGGVACAQQSANDTIRLGAIMESGVSYPMVFLDEFVKTGEFLNAADRFRRDKLRRDIYVVYPYAITAAAILKHLDDSLDNLDRRRDRKKFLRQTDRQLDAAFKQPLKNLSIDQGHILVKLINRQTGKNCYSIIRELKSGLSAVVWQSVGLMFKNNLRKDYDASGDDAELEALVQVLEGSASYRHQLYIQNELMRKIPRTVAK